MLKILEKDSNEIIYNESEVSGCFRHQIVPELLECLNVDDKNNKKIVFCPILNGGIYIYRELCFYLKPEDKDLFNKCNLELIACRSYDDNKGVKTDEFKIELFKDLEYWINENTHVYLIDDICDTGDTLFRLIDKLKSFNKDVNITTVALIDRMFVEKKLIEPDIVGFKCPSKKFLLFDYNY
jgi:hypoxanthine-guanine phosphoribosyltransferase